MLVSREGVLKTNASAVSLLQRLVDIGVVLLSMEIAGLVTARYFPGQYLDLLSLTPLVILLVLLLYNRAGVYRSWRTENLWREIATMLLPWGKVLVATSMLSFFLRGPFSFSPVFLFIWAGVGTTAQVVLRTVNKIILRKLRSAGRNTRNVLIFGTGELGQRTAAEIENQESFGFNLLGFLDDEQEQESVPGSKWRVLGSFADCESICKNLVVDHVYLCLPIEKTQLVKELVPKLSKLACQVHWVPDLQGVALINQKIDYLNDMPVATLAGSPLDPDDRLAKDIFDKVAAFIILLFALPLMAIIAVTVRLTSPGPVIFHQVRHGIGRKAFRCLKFRSMYVHEPEGDNIVQARRDDPRVTPVGTFLRRTSMDELPQLINVLKGEMSLVGPRPHACVHNEEYSSKIDGYMLRHLMKPGLTGWAQVNGWRGETETLNKMQNRVEDDLYYVANWSIWLDVKILFKTLIEVFRNKNAY